MFREYKPKDDVQKKSYYTDRFLVTPEIPKESISDEAILAHIDKLSTVTNVIESYTQREQAIVYVNAAEIKQSLNCLKEQGYTQLTEMSAIDWLAQRNGFEVFYQLLNVKAKKRLRVKCFLAKNEAIESVNELFRSADWSEREMYDMFGIHVTNHPNLKRIMLPDDWHDYPLLKTYPLQGDEVAQWYEVDLIYGKEYRDVIGPEQRDAAYVDREDTRNFAQIGREVPFGEKAKDEITPILYQEADAKPPLIRTMNTENQEELKERK